MSRGGIMLTVIKKVMPSQKWVAEPVLLSMMQAAGLPAATSEHFSAFYKTHPGLLDSLRPEQAFRRRVTTAFSSTDRAMVEGQRYATTTC